MRVSFLIPVMYGSEEVARSESVLSIMWVLFLIPMWQRRMCQNTTCYQINAGIIFNTRDAVVSIAVVKSISQYRIGFTISC